MAVLRINALMYLCVYVHTACCCCIYVMYVHGIAQNFDRGDIDGLANLASFGSLLGKILIDSLLNCICYLKLSYFSSTLNLAIFIDKDLA